MNKSAGRHEFFHAGCTPGDGKRNRNHVRRKIGDAPPTAVKKLNDFRVIVHSNAARGSLG
jgi:hypothetical protein